MTYQTTYQWSTVIQEAKLWNAPEFFQGGNDWTQVIGTQVYGTISFNPPDLVTQSLGAGCCEFSASATIPALGVTFSGVQGDSDHRMGVSLTDPSQVTSLTVVDGFHGYFGLGLGTGFRAGAFDGFFGIDGICGGYQRCEMHAPFPMFTTVQMSAVPEPGTIALVFLAFGLALLAAVRKLERIK